MKPLLGFGLNGDKMNVDKQVVARLTDADSWDI